MSMAQQRQINQLLREVEELKAQIAEIRDALGMNEQEAKKGKRK